MTDKIQKVNATQTSKAIARLEETAMAGRLMFDNVKLSQAVPGLIAHAIKHADKRKLEVVCDWFKTSTSKAQYAVSGATIAGYMLANWEATCKATKQARSESVELARVVALVSRWMREPKQMEKHLEQCGKALRIATAPVKKDSKPSVVVASDFDLSKLDAAQAAALLNQLMARPEVVAQA